MRVLLDTHILLWWAADDPRLSRRARQVLRDPANELLFSVASAWELMIKSQVGKLTLPEPPARYIPDRLSRFAIGTLPVELSHALGLSELPLHHRDPFDRILIAQSQVERLPIVTADPQIAQYPVEIIW
jgi:PIN domain nuclease of toxin-antitoxin system